MVLKIVVGFVINISSLVVIINCLPQALDTAAGDSKEAVSAGKAVPLEITKFHIESLIQFRYARTQVVSHVRNPGTASNQATFTMTIPDSAFISSFSMNINDVVYDAEVKEKEEAIRIFDEAVSEGKGAGIVSKEARDSNIFKVSTNIEGGQKVIFKLIYEELLERKGGMYEHAINIDPNQIVDDLRVDVFINESLPISKLSVPELVQSNEIDAIDDGENKLAEVEKNVDGYAGNAKIAFAPDKFYQEEAGVQGISGQFVVRYDVNREGHENEVQVIDGYFVHYFVPENLDTLTKHAIFILDVSGSMSGEKIGQLKDAMFTVLDDMNENDYFNIITFSSGVNHWNGDGSVQNDSPRVIPANKGNKDAAIKHVLDIDAGGSTNINDAMLEGIKIAEGAVKNEELPEDIKPMIIFLTDGLPSTGETNGDAIKENIKSANSALDIPIFCIGFGKDADFDLIKDISEQANSFSKRIYEGSDAALQLENFYAEIASPIISNLKFDYVGGLVDNSSVSSKTVKTFFKGGEHIIAGKLKQKEIPDNQFLTIGITGDGKKGPYKKSIEICLRPSAEKESKPRALLVPIIQPSLCILPPSYPPRSVTQDFMQKLHAFINIKQLVKKSKLSDDEKAKQLRESALKLSLENNFVTDLTSLVVVRPDEDPLISSFVNEEPSTRTGALPSRVLNRAPFLIGSGPSLSSPVSFKRKSGASLFSVRSSVSKSGPGLNLRSRIKAGTFSRRTSTPPNIISSLNTISAIDSIGSFDSENGVDSEDYKNSTAQCNGNLTLFSKTYLRGENVILNETTSDFIDKDFDDVSVSASVSGSCCWVVFSEKQFQGKKLLLSSKKTYKSVSSLEEFFRDVSSAMKVDCMDIL